MNTYKIIFLLFFSSTFTIAQETVQINDPNFEVALIKLGIDSDRVTNGKVLKTDAEKVTELTISRSNITSLSAISAFKNLVYLDCSDNAIKELSMDENLRLQSLDCSKNILTKLSVHKNSLLYALNCSKNLLTEITINSENFKGINCTENSLKTLSIENSKELSILIANKNKLTQINLTSFPTLLEIHLNDNLLTSININSNLNLVYLNLDNNKIKELDLCKNKSLKRLFCSNNPDLKTITMHSSNKISFETTQKEFIQYQNGAILKVCN